MSGMNILTCDCTCPTEGVDCVCDVTEIYMSCGRHKLEIYETLPEKGVEGVTYFIGNNEDGYVEYVWSCGKFVEMGTATATLIAPMTTTKLGLGKLSTSEILTESNGGVIGMNGSQQLLAQAARVNALGTVKLSTSTELTTSVGSEDSNVIGGFVGFNSDKQLVAQCASLDRYGTVRLGSRFHPTYEVPYVVGIGMSTNSGKRGQLAFNLRRTQSDGSPGCLKYRQVSSDPVQYEMFIEEGSDTQMGIVKMLHTLSGYSEEEINARRETHAASVGLVLDGVEKFAEWFFTDERLFGYFDEWARTGNLAETIWNTDEYRQVLLYTVCSYVEASETVKSLIDSLTQENANAWLNEKVTDQYIDDMFYDRVVEVTKQIADEHWTDDLDKAIAESTAEQVELQTEKKITEWFSKKENVEAVSELVTEAVEDKIYESVEDLTVEYAKGVFNGKNKINVDGEERSFAEWASLEIQRLVNSQTTGLEGRINRINNRVFSTAAKAYTLAWDGTAVRITPNNNPAANLNNYDQNSHPIPFGSEFKQRISLPPGRYTVRLTSAPVAPMAYHEYLLYRATLYVDSKVVASSSYQWFGDTGKSNDERTQGYFTGIGIVDVPESGSVELKFVVNNSTAVGWGEAQCACVTAEFFM